MEKRYCKECGRPLDKGDIDYCRESGNVTKKMRQLEQLAEVIRLLQDIKDKK